MERQIDVTSAAERVVAGMQHEFETGCYYAAAHFAPLVESEIELMFLTSLMMAGRLMNMKIYIAETDDPPAGPTDIAVIPQYEWGGYRIDFWIRHRHCPSPIFIECDGHDFHERTKEQAERDRAKDRAIQAAGIPILRFTGREIWRDTGAPVLELFKFILNVARADGSDS